MENDGRCSTREWARKFTELCIIVSIALLDTGSGAALSSLGNSSQGKWRISKDGGAGG
jgi:hypothetical protein